MKKYKMNLLLFGEGEGGAGEAAKGGDARGVSEGNDASIGVAGGKDAKDASTAGNDALGVTAGNDTGAEQGGKSGQEVTPQPTADEQFEKLIKGEHKERFQKRIDKIIGERFKGQGEMQKRLQSTQGVIELIAQRYGVDPTNISAVQTAVESDREYLEKEASEKGMTVGQLAEFKRMERENRLFQMQQKEAEKRRQFEEKLRGWQQQGEAVKAQYPEFKLEAEFQNADFVKLIDVGIDVKTAYEVAHQEEILNGVAQAAEKKVMDSVKANGARPRENGVSGSVGTETKINVGNLNKKERRALAERALRGERISLT